MKTINNSIVKNKGKEFINSLPLFFILVDLYRKLLAQKRFSFS